MSAGRHRRRLSWPLRTALAVAVTGLTGTSLLALSTGPASADVTRCVGAVNTPGAFACYTSPRFNQSGLEKTNVVEFPVTCFGIGCTGDMLAIYEPGGDVGGRFTAVSYLGHSYTVYRPAESQPYVLTSDNPRLDAATTAQVLVLSATLDAANGLA